MTRPVTVRGVSFPSMAAAARALGVTSESVRHAADRGTLDNIGTGRQPVPAWCRKPVYIRGRRFPSRVDAAAALGIPSQYLTGYFATLAALAERLPGATMEDLHGEEEGNAGAIARRLGIPSSYVVGYWKAGDAIEAFRG